MRYTIKLDGINITDWVKNLPIHTWKKGNIGELPDVPSITMEVDNSEHIFTPGHRNSVLGNNWKDAPIEIFDTGILMFDGVLRNLKTSSEPATLELSSLINSLMNTMIPYYYSDVKNFAQISEDIYATFGIECDSYSYSRAKYFQNNNGLIGEASVNPTMNLTLLQLQKSLAQVGLCRHYFIGNTAYMEYSGNDSVFPITVTFTDDDIIQIQEDGIIEKTKYNGYRIQCLSGLALKEGLEVMPEINGSSDQAVRIPDVGAGYFLGDNLLAINNREERRIVIELAESEKTNWLSEIAVFRIQSSYKEIDQSFMVMGTEPTLLGIKLEGVSI